MLFYVHELQDFTMTQRTGASPHPALLGDDHAGPGAVERQLDRRLPSGRSLVLRTEAAGEEIEIRSGRGEVEVKIVLTAEGPVVTLGSGKLLFDSSDVSFRCQSFAVQAAQEVSLKSQGEVNIKANELRAETDRDIHLNGAYIRLNCTPGAPVPQSLATPQLDAASAAPHRDCAAGEAASPPQRPVPERDPQGQD